MDIYIYIVIAYIFFWYLHNIVSSAFVTTDGLMYVDEKSI